MRKIGTLEDWERAETFVGYLERRGVAARCEQGAGGGWEVWVEDEGRVEEGRALYSRYLSMPGAEEFQRVREELEAEREAREEREREEGQRGWIGVVDAVGLVCVAAWLAGRLGGEGWVAWMGFDAAGVKGGEVWRMVTPALWHSDFLGLLVNVWFLRWFGRPLEREIGRVRTGMLLVAAAVAGVLGEATAVLAAGGGGTWGLTGVVYGFYAYEWVRWRREGKFGGAANSSFALALMVWLGAGLFGVFGVGMPAAGAAGLLTGLAWGLVERKKGRAGC